MIALPLAAALLLALAAPAVAGPPAPPPEVTALRREIAALQVDRALSLTPEQARALLPVLRRAAEQVQAFRARVASPDPALVAALTRARDELRAGGEISPATRQALRDARAAMRAGAPARRDEAQALREEALAILTPAQQKALRSVELGVGGGAGRAAGADDEMGPGAWEGPGVGPGPGAGPGRGAGRGAGHGAGPGRGAGHRLLLLGVLTSDPFLSLLEARAR